MADTAAAQREAAQRWVRAHRRRVEILAEIRVIAREMCIHAGEPHAVVHTSEELLRMVDELDGTDSADTAAEP
jgi:ribosomal protein S19